MLAASQLPAGLFRFQDALVRWSLRRGRACIFADTGLGKTRIQLAWADSVRRETGHDVLILAPLAVAAQTVQEGAAIGIDVNHCRDGAEVRDGITITNYDRIHRFDTSRFGAVMESLGFEIRRKPTEERRQELQQRISDSLERLEHELAFARAELLRLDSPQEPRRQLPLQGARPQFSLVDEPARYVP